MQKGKIFNVFGKTEVLAKDSKEKMMTVEDNFEDMTLWTLSSLGDDNRIREQTKKIH